MALLLRILSDDPSVEAMGLVLDAPRIVIGRSKSCEVQLLDPTVSARHAVIRLEGGSNLIADEGSTNGTAVGRVRLPAHTPRVLTDGERIRVGRVWLEVGFGAGMASSPKDVQALAREHLRRTLANAGESVDPQLEVVEGPDQGLRVDLPADGELVIGRARDADLQLTDGACSRRHAAVASRGGGFVVRDLGSKIGATLGAEALGKSATPWKPEATLRLGDTVLALRDPLPELVAEARGGADLKMKPHELEAPPPGDEEPVLDAPPEIVEMAGDAEDQAQAAEPLVLPPEAVELEPPSAWSATVDMMVGLVAVALLALSGVGLMYVLG